MSEAVDNRRARASQRSKRKQASVAPLRGSASTVRGRAAELQLASSRASWRSVSVGGVLLVLCVVLGVQSANQSQQMRALYSELQKAQATQDTLLEQRSRLLLERGALNSYNSAEKLASEKLGMRFPETITRAEHSAAGSAKNRESGVGGVR